MAVKEVTSHVDRVKFIFSGALIFLALVGFYIFPQVSLLFRTVGLVGAFTVAAAVFFTTANGKVVAGFLQEARIELRKMIWPTKVETMQTTLIVLVAVIVVAIILWMLDLFLRWFMGMIIQ